MSYNNYSGKESEKEYAYIYLNHFTVHLKLTQYCKSTIVQLKKKHCLPTEAFPGYQI